MRKQMMAGLVTLVLVFDSAGAVCRRPEAAQQDMRTVTLAALICKAAGAYNGVGTLSARAARADQSGQDAAVRGMVFCAHVAAALQASRSAVHPTDDPAMQCALVETARALQVPAANTAKSEPRLARVMTGK